MRPRADEVSQPAAVPAGLVRTPRTNQPAGFAVEQAEALLSLIDSREDPVLSQQVRLACGFAWDAGWFARGDDPEGENPYTVGLLPDDGEDGE